VAVAEGRPSQSTAAPGPLFEVYAVRYASIPFTVRNLIADADPSRKLDIAMTVWVIRGGGRNVLVDAGFYRDRFMQQYHPAPYAKPSDAVETGLGIKTDEVTDIIVSHVHWDHADGLDLFPKARVWIQKDEYEHHVGENGAVLDRMISADDATMLFGLRQAGRVNLVNGDNQEIIPGVRVYTGGKHTFQSQYVGVQTRSGTVVLASDNMYLYENLDRHVPISQTLDAASNLAAQDRMRTIAAKPSLIIPGHDPAVFERFPVVKAGVVRID
jgi:glyoxylase-like metal-dependent hydrolase (beta-lactamase superfamily II)